MDCRLVTDFKDEDGHAYYVFWGEGIHHMAIPIPQKRKLLI